MPPAIEVLDTKNLPDRLELRGFIEELYTDNTVGPTRYRDILNRLDSFGRQMYELGIKVGRGEALGAS